MLFDLRAPEIVNPERLDNVYPLITITLNGSSTVVVVALFANNLHTRCFSNQIQSLRSRHLLGRRYEHCISHLQQKTCIQERESETARFITEGQYICNKVEHDMLDEMFW